MEAASRNRRIRFKSYTRPKSEPAKPPQKDEFDDEFLDLGDSDYSSSDSTSSDDENQSLSFPGNHSVKHNTVLCQQVYVKSCRYFDKVPSTYFFRRLKRTHIDLSHHGLGIDGVKSVAIALVSNTTVQRLDISNNDISSEGLAHILQTLQENIVITDLNLSNNNLSTGGAVLLDEALSNNRIITILDISAVLLILKKNKNDASTLTTKAGMISKQPYKNKVVFPENTSKVVEIQTEPIKKKRTVKIHTSVNKPVHRKIRDYEI
ncbi:Hypothetical predicted protein [Mytilus galloprovincialis]|uniref:Uncharacterized protein n=1 Tax=Mytilus galloprovincialis TaxID=29158 RepID=A0A8B6BK59_MYTGA|nr:Hypothetical predicted protein [Mytilus galloprovincialis]